MDQTTITSRVGTEEDRAYLENIHRGGRVDLSAVIGGPKADQPNNKAVQVVPIDEFHLICPSCDQAIDLKPVSPAFHIDPDTRLPTDGKMVDWKKPIGTEDGRRAVYLDTADTERYGRPVSVAVRDEGGFWNVLGSSLDGVDTSDGARIKNIVA